jgi:hypothetical protein
VVVAALLVLEVVGWDQLQQLGLRVILSLQGECLVLSHQRQDQVTQMRQAQGAVAALLLWFADVIQQLQQHLHSRQMQC